MNKLNTKKEGQVTGKRYAELLCDFMFKRLFGTDSNKDILIRFLNIVLQDNEIVDVSFIPTEHSGMTEEDRKVIFDISCRCKDGRTFIIEMQKGYQKYFRERALYYTTYPINEQARDAKNLYIKEKTEGKTEVKFDWDYNLKPVTVVAILNFQFKHTTEWPTDRFRSSYRLREDTYQDDLMTDALRFVFIELGRFNKYLWELETLFDKWLYLLKHMHEMQEIPKEFSDPFFVRLFMLAEINKFTTEEKEQYLKSLGNMGDYANIINSAAEEAHAIGKAEGLEEGFEKGREEGREEGKAESKLETAKNFKALGVATDIISKATGLPVEIIEKLK